MPRLVNGHFEFANELIVWIIEIIGDPDLVLPGTSTRTLAHSATDSDHSCHRTTSARDHHVLAS